jgi:hypothetical protein
VRKLKDNIKMHHKELGCEGVDWIHLPQVKAQRQGLFNTLMNLPVPQKAENILTS